jgi:uncharacterized membrane protein YkgB
VYGWFGLLKVIAVSPANPLVNSLLQKTLPFITFDQFIVVFGVLEVVIGVLWLIPRLERVAAIFLGLHLVTTLMPLIVLPSITWQGWGVPTLEGQYIIKNVLIMAAALHILANKKPA